MMSIIQNNRSKIIVIVLLYTTSIILSQLIWYNNLIINQLILYFLPGFLIISKIDKNLITKFVFWAAIWFIFVSTLTLFMWYIIWDLNFYNIFISSIILTIISFFIWEK